MEQITIASENMQAIGFAPSEEAIRGEPKASALAKIGTLFIRFNNGISYSYDAVPHSYYAALQEVASAGRFFHHYIRGKFRYRKLDKDPFTNAS